MMVAGGVARYGKRKVIVMVVMVMGVIMVLGKARRREEGGRLRYVRDRWARVGANYLDISETPASWKH